MYAPHTVTVYNVHAEYASITILRGVFLDISQGANIVKTGLSAADKATLYIPFSVEAVNAVTGQEQRHLPPKEYDRMEDKSGYWTIGKHGKGSANNCFFIKGEIVETDANYADLNDCYDYVYNVSTVDVRDFGSPNMQHWQVGGN